MNRARHNFSSAELKIAVIGDEDTVAGFLLAGIGDRDRNGTTNFLIVTAKTTNSMIEDTFKSFTQRNDIAVILINQHCAERIRGTLDTYHETIPTVLEIPSKDAPYDPAKDSVMQRVKLFFGGTLPA